MMGQQQQMQQQPQGQAVPGNEPTVTEADDDQDGDRRDFLGGQKPYAGPQNVGSSPMEMV